MQIEKQVKAFDIGKNTNYELNILKKKEKQKELKKKKN